MPHHNGRGVKDARLATPSRNRYQFGLMLDVRRLELEQSYFNRKRWLINRLALGDGVLCGLPVSAKEGTSSVTVGPGVAVDGWGREIVVPVRSPAVDVRQPTDDCGAPDGERLEGAGTVTVELCYHECETEPVPVSACDCEGDTDCAPSIVRERYRVRVRNGLPEARVPRIDDESCRRIFGDAPAGGSTPGHATPGTDYAVVATIPVGGTPFGVAVTSAGRRGVVHGTGAGLVVIDVVASTVVATLDVGGVRSVAAAADGGPAFAAGRSGIAVLDIDAAPPAVIRTMLEDESYGACAAAFGGKVLYAVNQSSGALDRIDVGSGDVTPIDVGEPPSDVAVAPANRWVYVLSGDGSELARIDPATGDVVETTQSDDTPRTLAVRQKSGRAVAFCAARQSVDVVEEGGQSAARPLAVDPVDSAFSTDGTRYHVVSYPAGGAALAIFAADDLRELARVPLGLRPQGVAVVPNGTRVLVATSAEGTVTVVDVVGGSQPPAHEHGDRRRTLCEELSGRCPDPADDPCVPLATIELNADGTLGAIDACSYRPVVYGNDVLLDLILCLADRVDECCGGHGPETPVGVVELRAVSGNNQRAPSGTAVREPLVVEVLRDGEPVAGEAVTFRVTSGGGVVGPDAATLGASAQATTAADGRASLAVWRLGSAGPQGVAASIAAGTPRRVDFEATAHDVEVDPPRITALWVPPLKILRASGGTEQDQAWLRDYVQRPRLEITFDREMDRASLEAPDEWLRLTQIRSLVDGRITSHVPPPDYRMRRLPLRFAGEATSPVVGVDGQTVVYELENYSLSEEMGGGERAARAFIYVVQVRAEGDSIVDTSPTPVLLDAEFVGTGLDAAGRSILWGAGTSESQLAPDVMKSIIALTAVPVLPSGDGVAGGVFTSFFGIFQSA